MNVKFFHAAIKEIHPDAGDQYVLGEEIGTGKANGSSRLGPTKYSAGFRLRPRFMFHVEGWKVEGYTPLDLPTF